jgi:hypothetical protein
MRVRGMVGVSHHSEHPNEIEEYLAALTPEE